MNMNKGKQTAVCLLLALLLLAGTIRAEQAVFDGTADIWLLQTGSEHVLGIGRYREGEKLLALFNFGDAEETVWLNDPTPTVNLVTGEPQSALKVTLPAAGFCWLGQKFDA